MNRSDPLIPADEASYLCTACGNRFDVLGTWEMDEIDGHMYFYAFKDEDKMCCGVEADLR
jgi:hypothetical protein